MKKRILFAVMMMVALGAAADRFYIEDFEIGAGETCTVSIQLDNEGTYTAFQTDLYLPEGLTVEQEDGDYIFDLTSRKARDHNIAAQLQPNGSIRLMSYSINVNAYKGNSGALVTFNVTASADFAGPAVMALRNTLFTTTEGQEIPLADEECNVTVPSSLSMGDVNGDGNIDVGDVTALISKVLGNEVSPFFDAVADLNDDGKLDVGDVTMLISMVLSSN